jgi:hypothetical protein
MEILTVTMQFKMSALFWKFEVTNMMYHMQVENGIHIY